MTIRGFKIVQIVGAAAALIGVSVISVFFVNAASVFAYQSEWMRPCILTGQIVAATGVATLIIGRVGEWWLR